jgi:hypothetical protein
MYAYGLNSPFSATSLHRAQHSVFWALYGPLFLAHSCLECMTLGETLGLTPTTSCRAAYVRCRAMEWNGLSKQVRGNKQANS